MGAVSSHTPPGSRIEISGPHGEGRFFHVDLVRGDNGRRVCRAVSVNYGSAILSAGRAASPDLPVVDVVRDPTAPRFEPEARL